MVNKFVAKLLKYSILFKDILTFLGLCYKRLFVYIIVPCCHRNQFFKIKSKDNHLFLKLDVFCSMADRPSKLNAESPLRLVLS